MKKIYYLTLVLLIFSCSEDKENQVPNEEHPEFYIKATINGDSIMYDKEYLNERGNGAYYTYEGDPNSSSLGISRIGPEGNFITLLVKIQIDSIVTPYNIPKIPTYPFLKFEIQLGNSYAQPANVDNVTHIGSTLSGSDINLSILDKENDIVFGTFSGELKSNTGLTAIIENGEFRTKFIRVERN